MAETLPFESLINRYIRLYITRSLNPEVDKYGHRSLKGATYKARLFLFFLYSLKALIFNSVKKKTDRARYGTFCFSFNSRYTFLKNIFTMFKTQGHHHFFFVHGKGWKKG